MKPNNKKTVATQGKSTTKKRFSFTRKQLTIAGIVGVIGLSGVGYWAYSMFSIDDANAGNCVSTKVRKGSRGTCVRYVQQMLNIKDDGTFGSGTLSSVQAFQRRAQVNPDGVVGPATWWELCRAPWGSPGVKNAAGCTNYAGRARPV